MKYLRTIYLHSISKKLKTEKHFEYSILYEHFIIHNTTNACNNTFFDNSFPGSNFGIKIV